MKRLSRILYIAVIVILAAVFLYCAGSLVAYFAESRENQSKYDDLANLVDAARPTQAETQGAEDVPEPTSPYVTVTDPDTGEELEILREYAEAYKLNNDLVGWIRIDGTTINYPVVQRPEQTDYYLRRDFYGEKASHGCIYAREQCDVTAPSDNITIYGHRMKDGTMFAPLAAYEDKAYWEANQYIQFDTLTEHHTYQIIAVFLTTATLGEGFQYHLFVDAEDTSDFNSFIARCKQLALYETGLSAAPGDKLITLSTCEYTQENGRLVVVAKKIS